MLGKFLNRVPEGFGEIEQAEVLLKKNNRPTMISQIRDMVGTTDAVWRDFYKVQLERVALMSQNLPASEYHHHAYSGGLLDHSLEVAHLGCSIRRGIENPLTERAEDMVTKRELFSFAIFTTCLNHDIGKIITRHKLWVTDGKAPESEFNPYSPITDQGKYFKYEFQGNNFFDRHEPWAMAVIPSVIGEKGMGWLYGDKQIYSWVMDYFTGRSNPLAEVVKTADGKSVSLNMGRGSKGEITSVQGRAPFMIQTYIREALDNKEIDLNKPGAGGFVVGDQIMFVQSVLIEVIVRKFKANKTRGLPSSHSRILDMLVEYGYAIQTQGRAVEKYLVSSDEWPNETPLSLIRIRSDFLYQTKEQYPENWSGEIVQFEEKAAVSESHNKTAMQNVGGDLGGNRIAPTINDDDSDGDIKIVGWKAKESTKKIEPKVEKKEPTINAADPSIDQAKQIDDKPSQSDSENSEQTENNDLSRESDFVSWLIWSVNEGKLTMNKRDSPIHLTGVGVALLSPMIFRLRAEVEGIEFQKIQAELGKTDLFIRSPKKGRIFKFEIQGKRKVNHINAWILSAEVTEKFKKEVKGDPSVNQHLKLVPGGKS